MKQLESRDAAISRLYSMISKGPLASSSTRLMFRQWYDTYYGIFNHDAPNVDKVRPMALAAMFPQEDPWTYSMKHRYMVRFRKYEIFKHHGLSLTAFFQLPFHEAEQLFLDEQQEAKEAMKRMEEQERKLKEQENALRETKLQTMGRNIFKVGR